jgi:outer membrane protein OmpA-like peptidoglycan-associated protein
VFGTSRASAQTGFAVNRFEASEKGSDWFVLDSLDLRGHLRPAAGITGDWAYKPLVAYNPDGSERGSIVQHDVTAALGASLVLWDRLRGSFNLPLSLYQTGDGPTLGGSPTRMPSSAVGDLRLSADVRLLGEYGDPVTLAIGAALYLPTGSQDNYTSDGNVRFSPRASIAGTIPLAYDLGLEYAGRFGFNYRPLTDKIDTVPLGSELTLGASAGVRMLDKKLLVGPEIYGSTGTNDGAFFEKSTTPLEWLLGGHYTVGDFRLGGGFGSGLTRGWGSPVIRIVLGAEWAPAFDVDQDKDGILDAEDACPTVPGIRTNDPKTNGCPPPPPPADFDRDGIPDDVDACPQVPGVKSDDPKRNGCPPDRDNDGIEDPVDACPDVPGVKDADPKKNGCPPDRDNDGIVDKDDACPDVPGEKSDDPKKNGCPPDRDGDGIYDKDDACPDAPGPANPDPKKNGCPLARIEDGQVKITEHVNFKTDSAIILKDSDPVLYAVAAILKDHPEITKVRVEGHTDNKGNANYNRDLSRRRAASVVKWLTSVGIDGKRLTAKGIGMDAPIDTNATDEGRANNRRVEFHIENAPPPKAK